MNKVNVRIGKKQLSLPEAIDAYAAAYAPDPVHVSRVLRLSEPVVYGGAAAALVLLIYVFRE